ncbi:MAG: hypothetical protein ACXVAY_10760 [Mucilaginibacter sp.]
MKNILVIDDNSAEARHAAEFAFLIAQKMKVNILLAHTQKVKSEGKLVAQYAGNYEDQFLVPTLGEYLDRLNDRPNDFEPVINEIDASEMNESQFAYMVNHNDVLMIVKSMGDHLPSVVADHQFNINAILNTINSPILFIPPQWSSKNIERLVYIADLRYCRLQIVRYLTNLAKSFHADLSIAQLAARGLPHIDEDYAQQLFKDEVCCQVNYDQLFFNNIRENDLTVAVDVLINGMHNDILVLLNHQFHFEEIVGQYLTNILPKQIIVPLLVFPY